jgi:hypothetical protein
MTNEELTHLDALAAAATPGPWEAFKTIRDYGDVEQLMYGDVGMPMADATFIAAARTGVPALVAEVRKLWGIVHSAWEEAYDAGQRSVRETEAVPVVWLSSKTRAALGDA